jgi:hypothetical protein
VKRSDGLLLALCALLSVGVAAAAARVADRYQQGGSWRLELGRARQLLLDPQLEQRLSGLTDDLVFTYYVSPRSHMPSAMKRTERDVTDLLEAMQAANPDKVDVLIVDPETDPDQRGYASNRRITPFRVRDVAHDAWSERLVWSALTMACGARGEAVINGITPERLPRLQATVAEHLARIDAPRRPKLALAAPPGFRELADALAEHGDVVEVDLDGGAPFPADADVLFWMRPTHVTPERLRELDRALLLGRSAVVAGSLYRLPADGIYHGPDGALGARLAPSGDALEALGSHFGLGFLPELPCDQFAEAQVQGDQQTLVPFLVRCIAPNQSFVTWRNQPNGTLLFRAPAALRLEADALRDLGYAARVHATTSDDTWLIAPPLDAPRAIAQCTVEHGSPTSKLPLMVSLEPSDPWRGRLVVLGASTPFEDGTYSLPGTAHWRLARTLVDELGAPERLVAAATAEVGAPPPAPELSGGRRLLWRALVIGLVPLLLLCAAFARGMLRPSLGRRARAASGAARLWPRAALALALALLVARLASLPSAAADATADGVNSLAPETRAIAARAGQAGETKVELFFSPRAELPPSLRAPAGRVRQVLDDFARAGADLDVERADVQGLDEAARAALEKEGVATIQIATRDEEVTTVRTVYSALRLSRGERSEVLAFEDAASFEFLEFRLAFALWRLETGRKVKVALAADAERMSAAEDYDFQQAGLFAPKGNDPYSLARGLLYRLDFDVANVTPRQFVATRATQVPRDADLLVWLQPRRSIETMMEETVRYLHGGGDVLIAAQHFKILSRQYRGRKFQMSYWPRPQSPDIDQVYLPEIGVRMPRDVVFDELCTEEYVDTEVVGRRGGRDYERQLSTRPFQVRVSAADFDREHPITRDLGDQAFPWASRFELDQERLSALGLKSTVLMTTTERTWTFPWKGGFLEEGAPDVDQHLDGPPRGPDGTPQYQGRLPLAVLVEGQFPRPEKPLRIAPGTADAPADPEAEAAGWTDPKPGRLMLVGDSNAFQDERLHDPEFRADRLLLNSVAYLALEPELAAIATRHRAVRGFGYLEPEQKLSWRSLVLAAPPAGVLLLGAAVALARRRPPARRTT